MLPNTTATMKQSSAVPTTASVTMVVDMTGTLLEGVASTLDTILIVDVVKCVWVSKRCVCTLLHVTGEVTDGEL